MSVPSCRLQPLRIPNGWVVHWNTFYEVDPKFETLDDTALDFSEDMLFLINRPAGVAVDLGWYPEASAEGSYCLSAIRLYDDEDEMCASWDHPLKQIRTRSRHEVVATIESWLGLYNQGSPQP